MTFNKLTAFTQKVADSADQLTGNPAETKAIFDKAPEELRTYFNNLVDALKSTATGDSGAKNTGVTAITGLTGTDVQTLLESLKTYSDKMINAGQTGFRIEITPAIFFTNGGSNNSTATVTFTTAFNNPPSIFVGDMYQAQAFGDVILCPYIYNVSKTGFQVKITASGGSNLGTVGSPANIFMHFLAIGN